MCIALNKGLPNALYENYNNDFGVECVYKCINYMLYCNETLNKI